MDHAYQLFARKLKYDVFPDYSLTDATSHNVRWARDQLAEFLDAKAAELEQSIRRGDADSYDGLVVLISGHGLKSHVCCSDYKVITKTDVHRIFSKRPLNRTVPRAFVFDCCAGDSERLDENRAAMESGEIDLQDVVLAVPDKVNAEWAADEVNPDYMLVEVHAANVGFEAKMRMAEGSYLITEFPRNFDAGRFLFELFDAAQSNLHGRGKQLTQNVFNNGTRYVKFIANTRAKDKMPAPGDIDAVQLSQHVSHEQSLSVESGSKKESECAEDAEIVVVEEEHAEAAIEIEMQQMKGKGAGTGSKDKAGDD